MFFRWLFVLLAITLSVLLWFTDSNYNFRNSKFFIHSNLNMPSTVLKGHIFPCLVMTFHMNWTCFKRSSVPPPLHIQMSLFKRINTTFWTWDNPVLLIINLICVHGSLNYFFFLSLSWIWYGHVKSLCSYIRCHFNNKINKRRL